MTITRPPNNLKVCRGSRVTITCGYQIECPDALPVTWIINGMSFTADDIMDNPMYRLKTPTTPNAPALTIQPINGNVTIQCIVYSTTSTTSAPGTVTVAAGMCV